MSPWTLLLNAVIIIPRNNSGLRRPWGRVFLRKHSAALDFRKGVGRVCPSVRALPEVPSPPSCPADRPEASASTSGA